MKPAEPSHRAKRDLVAAAIHIAADSPAAARRFRQSISELGHRVGEFPDSGDRRPELASVERYRFFDLAGFPYLIVVDSERRPPEIIRILHTSRDIQALLGA